jgi:16S rRNA (cytidine1402-2'-O)-methyltransferase
VKAGILYLIPAPLGLGDIAWAIPPAVRQSIAGLAHFIVEHPKTARQFLKQIGCVLPIQIIKMEVLDEHTRTTEFEKLLAPVLSGNDVGLLSEAGCPAIADPGAGLVRLAHQKNIRVRPMVGPSSILLALMASGLNGQRFVFHGYLPVEPDRRTKKLVQLEKDSITRDQTQIFIETPYRNQKLLESLLRACKGDTVLCIASNLTLAEEHIATRTVNDWKHALPDINDQPAVFLLQA